MQTQIPQSRTTCLAYTLHSCRGRSKRRITITDACAAFFHMLVRAQDVWLRCRGQDRQLVNALTPITSAAVPPNRYPNLDRQSLHRVLAMVTVLAWFLIPSVDPARIRGIAPMKVFAAAPSTPARRSPPSVVLVGRRMRVAEQGTHSKLHHAGGPYRVGRRRPVLTSCPATRWEWGCASSHM